MLKFFLVSIPYRNVINRKRKRNLMKAHLVSIPYRNVINKRNKREKKTPS